MSNSSGRPTVFIGYSHRDEAWKDRFAAALKKTLDLRHDVEVWSDRRIMAGEGWVAEIEAVVSRAKVAVLLISPDFLTSGFIRRPEIPRLLQRWQEEGLLVTPLFVRPSPWEGVSWLADLQGRPKNTKPLSKYGTVEADRILEDFALEIRSWLSALTESTLSREREGAKREGRPGAEIPPRLRHRRALDLPEGPELATLYLLSLFDGPAQFGAIAALRAKPAIPGLTEPLIDLNERAWQLVLSNLRRFGLLLANDPRQPGVLDIDPVDRRYLQEDLKTVRPEAWKAGNLRLYEYLRKKAPDLPDTLEAMEPLFTAVVHGCRAGRQQEALDEVYIRRIQRGNEFYSSLHLGSLGLELSALSGFFDRQWDQPSASLSSRDQAFVLNEVGFCLRSLGRLAEAVQPIEASLRVCLSLEDWTEATVRASNLSGLTLVLGELERALSFAKQSVDLADRSGNAFGRMASKMALADTLHQSGRLEESAEAFREAGAPQAQRQSGSYSRLYSLWGYRYGDLLLSRIELELGGTLDVHAASPETAKRMREASWEVQEWAEQMLALNHLGLLDVALSHLVLGRAHLNLADFAKAVAHLDHAVEGLRKSGEVPFMPSGLLARAALRRLQKDWSGAEADLSETLEIAERGLMRLHECDAHLEWARLCRDRGDRDGLQRHLARARKLVEETGYGRRTREVESLEEPGPPSSPPVKLGPAPSIPIYYPPLEPEDLLLLVFRLVATRRTTPDLLLHLDASRLREAADRVLTDKGQQAAENRLRAVASILADEVPDLPDPLWQSWMLTSQRSALQDLASALASDLPA